jgi:hypothetical protein
MRKQRSDSWAGLAAALFLLVAACGAQAEDAVVAPDLQGHWKGNARIIVNWCLQTNLHVELDIHSDGTVSGTVGDARLHTGWIDRNRGWLGRALHVKTDYIIRGRLQGPIVAAEGITRARVFIPFNARNGAIVGGVATSGTALGGKKSMVFTAASLQLTRPP